MKYRDTQLDIYRGIIMMHIICIIHAVTFLHFWKEPIMSILLFEMPVIFFIAGASLSLSNKRKSLGETVLNRFKRVIIPYYIYVVVMLIIVALLSVVWHFFSPQIESIFGNGFISKFSFDITKYTWHDVYQIIICDDIPQSPYVYHLWFIPVYFILSCTFPLQLKCIDRMNRWLYIGICIAAFCLTVAFTENRFIRNLFCYNVFIVGGYLLYKKLEWRQIVFIAAMGILAVSVYLKWFGDFVSMHDHKFPADILFLSYNTVVICIFSLILGKVKLPNLRIFQIWNKHGYSIYLYHSFVLFIVYIFLLFLVRVTSSRIIQLSLCVVLMFLLSTYISFLTTRLEGYVMNRLFSQQQKSKTT